VGGERGMSNSEGERPSRIARITTIGMSAATEPLGLTRALRPAASSMLSTTRRVWLSPTRAMSCWPAQVVTPVASSASLTMNSGR
jgi:hypothetical protein